jgi:hypothetical protein
MNGRLWLTRYPLVFISNHDIKKMENLTMHFPPTAPLDVTRSCDVNGPPLFTY